MAKILNLDGLSKETRSVRIGGVAYRMKDISVGDFIDITKRADEIAEQKGSIIEQIEFLIDTVAISFPDCPKDVLRNRTMEELNALVAFARDGSLPEGAAVEGDEDEKKAQAQD